MEEVREWDLLQELKQQMLLQRVVLINLPSLCLAHTSQLSTCSLNSSSFTCPYALSPRHFCLFPALLQQVTTFPLHGPS